MEAIALYARLVSAQLRSQMQYKVSFSLALLGSFLVNLTEFGLLVVLFTRIPRLAGWSLAEVALLYGLSGLSFATAEIVGSALDDFKNASYAARSIGSWCVPMAHCFRSCPKTSPCGGWVACCRQHWCW
jgi:hypothetical protein